MDQPKFTIHNQTVFKRNTTLKERLKLTNPVLK